jgi:DNA topoisomerase I
MKRNSPPGRARQRYDRSMASALRKLQQSFESPEKAAKQAGLKYVQATAARGIYRVRQGKGFGYRDERGKAVRSADILSRIRSLAIPPAWENVWICPSDVGHLQAIGTDARGRKQYRYHPEWRAHRDLAKYTHMIDFAEALPQIRATVKRHLRKKGLPREKVLAATIAVLEKTLIRVGSDEYAKQNKTYGLTTLQDKHAEVTGAKIVFDFRAKHGIKRRISFRDPRLADIIRKCRDLPGE